MDKYSSPKSNFRQYFIGFCPLFDKTYHILPYPIIHFSDMNLFVFQLKPENQLLTYLLILILPAINHEFYILPYPSTNCNHKIAQCQIGLTTGDKHIRRCLYLTER